MATVTERDVGFGMARMYELRRGQEGTNGVFRSVDEALAWLGVPPDARAVDEPERS